MSSIRTNYYVYIHIKPGTDKVFYVGKGIKGRYICQYNRNKYWNNIVNKYGFDTIKIEENLTEEKALELEIYWIAQFKAWNFKLVNLTEGGDIGNPIKGRTPWNKGKKMSQITKNKISKIQIGVKKSNETKKRISQSNKRPRSKIVLDLNTGIFYNSVKEASFIYSIKHTTLLEKLNGNNKNNTSLIYI